MPATIYDIAREADVSIATVSRVLNNSPRVAAATRDKVNEVAAELGYQPHASARSLAMRSSNVISAVVPMMSSYFFVEVLQGMQEAIEETDQELIVYSSGSAAQTRSQLDRALQHGRSDGVLLVSTDVDETIAGRLREANTPVVLVDSGHPDLDSIFVNNEEGGFRATAHLVESGSERIALITGNGQSAPDRHRRAGYQRAIQEAGLEIDPGLISASDSHRQDGFTEEGGYSAMQRLLAMKVRPDAVFCTSDIKALGAMRALQDAELDSPSDIQIVGFDDIMVSRHVGLSTMRQPMYQMGKLAIKTMIERLDEDESDKRQLEFVPDLVKRDTTSIPA